MKHLLTAFVLLPTLAFAHPGHYHPPGEDDEFDAITTALQSLPGWQCVLLAASILGVAALLIRRKSATPAH